MAFEYDFKIQKITKIYGQNKNLQFNVLTNRLFQYIIFMDIYIQLEHQNKKEAQNMATSSFTKTFVFSAEAIKKVETAQKQPGAKVPSPATDRVKEGKEALARFSSPSKK